MNKPSPGFLERHCLAGVVTENKGSPENTLESVLKLCLWVIKVQQNFVFMKKTCIDYSVEVYCNECGQLLFMLK